MRNLKLTIEYDGTNYCGWQTQKPKCKTIQETLEKAFQKILQEKLKIIGSGRTDAGVHAFSQVANFKTNSLIPVDKLQKAINSLLPEDIVVTKIEEVDLKFNSQFAAKTKVYRYLILNQPYPSALMRDKVYFYSCHLDIKLMQQEARCLMGKHDFRAFCASGSNAKYTVRTIKRISINRLTYSLSFDKLRILRRRILSPSTRFTRSERMVSLSNQSRVEVQLTAYSSKDLPLIAIDIEADGFLYNMVRNIVGTLIEVGRCRMKRGELKKILLAKDRRLAGPIVPAKGLYLVKVDY